MRGPRSRLTNVRHILAPVIAPAATAGEPSLPQHSITDLPIFSSYHIKSLIDKLLHTFHHGVEGPQPKREAQNVICTGQRLDLH